MEAIDAYGFAGGITLGVHQAGWDVVGKREKPAGFGVPLVLANERLYGVRPEDVQCAAPAEWEARAVPFVFGNPPCSGFSNLSVAVRTKDGARWLRGPDSSVNECMWELVRFAARCGPEVMAFESVQGAYSRGRGLMLALREELERLTRARWDLVHVKHSAASLGGNAIRKRYFAVFTQVPFGVEERRPLEVRTVDELLGDLQDVPVTCRTTRGHVVTGPAPWPFPQSPDTQVDGHFIVAGRPLAEMLQLIDLAGGYDAALPYGLGSAAIAKELLAAGRLPAAMNRKARLSPGAHDVGRWRGDRPPRVIAGGSFATTWHPHLPRPLSFREQARVLGYPDDLTLRPLEEHPGQRAGYLGKGITVQCGEWLGTWVRESVEGRPGIIVGEGIGERERFIDLTYDYRNAVERARNW